MSDEKKNFSVMVHQTQQVRVQVLAHDEESAKAQALQKALSHGFASTQHRSTIDGSWPLGEPENGPVVDDEPGYVIRRGWFFVASTDDGLYAMTEEQLFADHPEADMRQPKTMFAAFAPHTPRNETIFNVERAYGYAVRYEGRVLWDGPAKDEREARRTARRFVQLSNKRKAEAQARADYQATIDLMRAPGNADSLFKTRGGRWSVRSVIGNTTNPAEIELTDDVWWVDVKLVNRLIENGDAKAVLQYEKSGAPLAITLTDAVLRPF